MASLYEFATHPAVIGLASGVIGGLFGYLGARTSKPHDLQASLNSTVATLVAGFETGLKETRDELRDARRQIGQQAHVIRMLNQHVVELTATLREHGIPSPPYPFDDDQYPLNLEAALT